MEYPLNRENYPGYFAWRDEAILEGELAFEREIKNLDTIIVCPVPRIDEHGTQPMFDYIERAEHWLAQNVRSRYLAFPTTAIGKYKECCFNVYFEDYRDAMLFKISVL